jgi:hypothetical protein
MRAQIQPRLEARIEAATLPLAVPRLLLESRCNALQCANSPIGCDGREIFGGRKGSRLGGRLGGWRNWRFLLP